MGIVVILKQGKILMYGLRSLDAFSDLKESLQPNDQAKLLEKTL